VLFEWHLSLHSAYNTFRWYRTLNKARKKSGARRISTRDSHALIEMEKVNFFIMTLFHLNHMGNSVKHNMFEITFFLDQRGLSDTGRDFMGKLDIGLSSTTYREYLTNHAEEVLNEQR
jgi:hypothetical protein